MIPLHYKFSPSITTYQLKFTVQDSGSPALNETITAYGKIKETLFLSSTYSCQNDGSNFIRT